MRLCEWTNCTQWAQWHAIRLAYPNQPLHQRERRRLCPWHKEIHQKEDHEHVKFTYQFIGAEPSGLNHS